MVTAIQAQYLELKKLEASSKREKFHATQSSPHRASSASHQRVLLRQTLESEPSRLSSTASENSTVAEEIEMPRIWQRRVLGHVIHRVVPFTIDTSPHAMVGKESVAWNVSKAFHCIYSCYKTHC